MGKHSPPSNSYKVSIIDLFHSMPAFIPTPIYFGALMDRTCRVRALPQRLICESQQHHLLLLSATKLAPLEGACLEYDVHALPFAWLGGVTVFKCLSILIAILTWRYSWWAVNCWFCGDDQLICLVGRRMRSKLH